MADSKISDLIAMDGTAGNIPVAGDLMHVVDSSGASNKKIDWDMISNSIINVKAYGAKGDGDAGTTSGTDDAPAIQAAFDAAVEGSVIYFPPGNYKVNTGITHDSNVPITVLGSKAGQGAGTIIINNTDTDGVFAMTLGSEVNGNQQGFCVKDIGFTGIASGLDKTIGGLKLVKSTHNYLESVDFNYFDYADADGYCVGLQLAPGNDYSIINTIVGCHAKSCAVAFYCEKVTGTRFYGCWANCATTAGADMQINGGFTEAADSTATGTNTTGWSWTNSGWETTGSSALSSGAGETLSSSAVAQVGRVYTVTYTIGTNSVANITAGGVALRGITAGTHTESFTATSATSLFVVTAGGSPSNVDNVAIHHGTIGYDVGAGSDTVELHGSGADNASVGYRLNGFACKSFGGRWEKCATHIECLSGGDKNSFIGETFGFSSSTAKGVGVRIQSGAILNEVIGGVVHDTSGSELLIDGGAQTTYIVHTELKYDIANNHYSPKSGYSFETPFQVTGAGIAQLLLDDEAGSMWEIRSDGSWFTIRLESGTSSFSINPQGFPAAPSYTVSQLEALTGSVGGFAYASDPVGGPALCFYNGSNWIDLLTGTTVTDT